MEPRSDRRSTMVPVKCGRCSKIRCLDTRGVDKAEFEESCQPMSAATLGHGAHECKRRLRLGVIYILVR
jgi:hypothetical protein